jgi:hypothetical protein
MYNLSFQIFQIINTTGKVKKDFAATKAFAAGHPYPGVSQQDNSAVRISAIPATSR